MSECRMPSCSEDARGSGGYSGRFCSDQCEVKYDHLKADARDARASEMAEAEEPEEVPY